MKASYWYLKNCSHYSITNLLGGRVTWSDLVTWPEKAGGQFFSDAETGHVNTKQLYTYIHTVNTHYKSIMIFFNQNFRCNFGSVMYYLPTAILSCNARPIACVYCLMKRPHPDVQLQRRKDMVEDWPWLMRWYRVLPWMHQGELETTFTKARRCIPL